MVSLKTQTLNPTPSTLIRKSLIVTVFGSSRPLDGDPEYHTAYDLGRMLAQAGHVVCNGGYGGIMEASARGAKEAGGKTIGVLTNTFGRDANHFIDRKIIKHSLLERLTALIELGNAYVVLRGGTGTLVELATVWEYLNKQLMPQKPLVVVGKFWSPVIATMKRQLAREGRNDSESCVMIAGSPESCVKMLNKRLGSQGTGTLTAI